MAMLTSRGRCVGQRFPCPDGAVRNRRARMCRRPRLLLAGVRTAPAAYLAYRCPRSARRGRCGRRRGASVTARSVGHEHGGRSRYLHDALLYDSAAELVDVAVPFLLDGLAAGDAAVVAAGADTASVLRDALDGDPRVHILE